MSDWTADIRTAFMGTEGIAKFSRVLYDEEIHVLYFEHFGVNVTEVWLDGSQHSDDDFEVWSNNSLNNDNAVVIWEPEAPKTALETHGWASKTCKFPGCDCDLPKEG